MKRRLLACSVVLLLTAAAVVGSRAFVLSVAAQASRQAPTFQVDPNWLKIPNNWVLGIVSVVALDKHDNVWIMHRPRTIPQDKQDHMAPSVLEFDKEEDDKDRPLSYLTRKGDVSAGS